MTGTGVASGKSASEVEEVSTLYATYAYDPKTASDEPRVIMQDADLIKISISDSGRDKRTGVLIRGASNGDAGTRSTMIMTPTPQPSSWASRYQGRLVDAVDGSEIDQHGDRKRPRTPLSNDDGSSCQVRQIDR